MHEEDGWDLNEFYIMGTLSNPKMSDLQMHYFKIGT